MALPKHLKNGLTPLEIEFLAENEMIEIAAAIDTRQDLDFLGMDGIGLMEINEIRPFFTKAHYEAEKLKRAKGTNNSIERDEEAREIFDGSMPIGSSIPESTRFNATQGSWNYQ
ncbi:hypothetical protein BGX27_000946 [Mortierella sp. AM989]|nr:hypothetical protein BGX27_000946 [Mortierella sp. AM989]